MIFTYTYLLTFSTFSSNVNEVIKTVLSQCIFFFLQKDIARTKTLTSKNQLTKQK